MKVKGKENERKRLKIYSRPHIRNSVSQQKMNTFKEKRIKERNRWRLDLTIQEPSKLSFNNEGESKIISDKEKQRVYYRQTFNSVKLKEVL